MNNDQTQVTSDTNSQMPRLVDCIYRIGRVMEQVDNFDKLLRTILDECRRLMQCEAASIALLDETQGDLNFSLAAGGAEQDLGRWRIPLGVGIVGHVAQTGESLICNDPLHDPRWFGAMAQNLDYTTRNLAAVPLICSGKSIGVLEIINRVDHTDFKDSDLQLLQIFADQVQVALRLQRLIQEKEQSDRLAGFALALADIGHTVKNILLRLKAPIGLIDMSYRDREWEKMVIAWPIMKRAIGEVNQLVLNMLTYAKPAGLSSSPTNVAELIGDVLGICRDDAAEKGVELRFCAPAGDWIWPLDLTVMSPVLHNLVGNAIEAIAGVGQENGEVTIELQKIQGELIIKVADNGPGIPRDLQPRLFKPFVTSGKRGGTGLGLANVKKGIEEHGGQVELASTPGQGTVFTLILPQRPEA